MALINWRAGLPSDHPAKNSLIINAPFYKNISNPSEDEEIFIQSIQLSSLKAQTALCGVVALRFHKVPQLQVCKSEPFD